MRTAKVILALVIVLIGCSLRLTGQAEAPAHGPLPPDALPVPHGMASAVPSMMPVMASWDGSTSTQGTAQGPVEKPVSPASLARSIVSPIAPEAIQPASETIEVTVGIYLQNVNDIDVKASAFMMDFYLWFLWRGEVDPTETFEFTNLLDSWSMTRQPVFAQPQILPDGRRYQVIHVQGKFNRKFDLSQFPLDNQRLVIEIEDSRFQSRELRYIADTQFSGFSPRIILPGWAINGFTAIAEPIKYQTSFGNPFQENNEVYARFVYSLEIGRPAGAYLFRMLLPIVVILLTGFVVFFVSPVYADTRVNVALTVLLSMVALHLTVSSDLPQVGYIRLIDKIYNLGYLVTFATLIESVCAVHLNDHGRRDEAQRLDRWSAMLIPILSFIGIGMLLMW